MNRQEKIKKAKEILKRYTIKEHYNQGDYYIFIIDQSILFSETNNDLSKAGLKYYTSVDWLCKNIFIGIRLKGDPLF